MSSSMFRSMLASTVQVLPCSCVRTARHGHRGSEPGQPLASRIILKPTSAVRTTCMQLLEPLLVQKSLVTCLLGALAALHIRAAMLQACTLLSSACSIPLRAGAAMCLCSCASGNTSIQPHHEHASVCASRVHGPVARCHATLFCIAVQDDP